ncbi:MAG: radical SAM protein, partial [Polyangiaceae bacterium]
MVSRSAVSLGLSCDGACVFCAQKGLDPAAARARAPRADVERRLEEARVHGDSVTFVGGEPALHPDLDDLVRRARALGFSRVGIQTNGWELAKPGRLAALAAAGLTDVHLSIHGAEARVHDWHAARPGAFDAALAAMTAARAAGLDVVVATVLTRSSFRVLTAIPRLLVGRGASAWCIEVPRWRGLAATHADRIVPRLSLALPFALHALDAAQAVGLPAFVRGAPTCLLGPFASRA